ncbi:hypothetical protein [Noviherbaspirillum cavernae]|uniref:hypothetical protein n=1 Tax=Noviherbaspirillum cavernae TaxID=2320862 RepID=UPI0011C45004|nr:hypothetical protein [Noviherbaspirillum cavernae]
MKPPSKKMTKRERRLAQRDGLPAKGKLNRRTFARLAGRTGMGLRAWRELRSILSASDETSCNRLF